MPDLTTQKARKGLVHGVTSVYPSGMHCIMKLCLYYIVINTSGHLKHPQTSSRSSLFFFLNVHAYCSTSMMLHVSALQSQVVKSRQVFRYSLHAHVTYHVGGKHCKRMASPYKHMGNTIGGHTSYLKVKIKIPFSQIASFCSFCMRI